MDDYITVLLNDLEDHASSFLDGAYYAAIHREAAAAEALEATLSPEQQALFDKFADLRNDSAACYQSALLRQAFLLGREVAR